MDWNSFAKSVKQHLSELQHQLGLLWQDKTQRRNALIICSLLTTTASFLLCISYKNKSKQNRSLRCPPYSSHFPSNYTICDPKLSPNAPNRHEHFNVPLPGNITVKDYRSSSSQTNSSNKKSSDPRDGSTPPTIRVVTWNIEFGLKLDSIIRELRALDADIILLQEVDVGCARTNFHNVGCEIAQVLGLQIIYAAAEWHINDPIPWNGTEGTRGTKSQGSSTKGWDDVPYDGCHGDAILTKFDVKYAYSLVMPCIRNDFRSYHAHTKRHTCPVAILDVSGRFSSRTGKNANANNYYSGYTGSWGNAANEMVCYSCHLDAYSGREARSCVQYRSIYEDVMKHHMGHKSFRNHLDTLQDKPRMYEKYARLETMQKLERTKSGVKHAQQYVEGNAHGETVYIGKGDKYLVRRVSAKDGSNNANDNGVPRTYTYSVSKIVEESSREAEISAEPGIGSIGGNGGNGGNNGLSVGLHDFGTQSVSKESLASVGSAWKSEEWEGKERDGSNYQINASVEVNEEEFVFGRRRRSVVIGGDFNTHNNGILRLFNRFSGGDPYRFKNLGQSEATWWNKHVFGREPWYFKSNAMQAPYLEVRDPFDDVNDATMDYRVCNEMISVFREKLDWLLYDINILYATNYFVSEGCKASDHEYCVVDVALGNRDKKKFRKRYKSPLPLLNRIVRWANDRL